MLRTTAFLLLLSAAVAPVAGQHLAAARVLDGTVRSTTRGERPHAVAGGAQAQASTADSLYEVVYDDGVVAMVEEEGQTYFDIFDFAAGAQRYANRFAPPEGSYLAEVAVAPYYRSEFAEYEPTSDQRDFRLHVWADEGGRPGEELFALDVTDDRANSGVDLVFRKVDLMPYRHSIGTLPETVYIGVSDAGQDDNYMLVPMTEYEGDNVSYLYLPIYNEGQGGWQYLDRVTYEAGVYPFVDRVVPVRATFAVDRSPVADEGVPDIPADVALLGAYPNPFNPATSVGYVLGRSADVRLEVYDALGRRVASYDEGVRVAGQHAVHIDAGGWPSGLYLYVLEAAGRRLDGRLVLVK